jgi:hypothetical protein
VCFLFSQDELDSAGEGAGWHGHPDNLLVPGVAEVGELQITEVY